jgi:protease-4
MSLLVVLGVRSASTDWLDALEGEKIGVVEIRGMLVESRGVLEDLKRFREDDEIRAIVLRIDSPGGTVGPAQEIYREVQRTRETKKVVASMGTVAASGGYYAAAAADGIMANPGTITGSIGVILEFTNFQQLFEKIGLAPVVVKSGEYKDIGSPAREMTPGERRILEDFARKIHRQFIRDVAAGRPLEPDRVEALADGRIFTGEESREAGLVDRLGNLEDALAWAGELAGVEGPVQPVYAREESRELLEYLLGTTLERTLTRLLQPRLGGGVLLRSDLPAGR